MNNVKNTLAVLIMLTTLAMHSSKSYIPASQAEFICHGRKPRNPLTMPLMSAITKKHRSKQKLPRAKDFLSQKLNHTKTCDLAII